MGTPNHTCTPEPGPFTRLLHDSGMLDLLTHTEGAVPPQPAQIEGPFARLLRELALEKGKGKDDGKGTPYNRHRGRLRREGVVYEGPRGGRYADPERKISLKRNEGEAKERSEAGSRPDPKGPHDSVSKHDPEQRPDQWKLGSHKSVTTWRNQMAKRGWTPRQIAEAIYMGERSPAANKVNKGNSASRYVHPTTGRRVIVDDVTQEVLHVSAEAFQE
ncbi:MAG: hypothetical protein AMXMBFR64_45780 [Myxococcales bacterium]